MGIKVANNAYGTLNAGISNVATTLVLNSGEGSRFPTLSAGDYFYATLIDTSNNLEIVKVTARATDTLTIVRAQDGTTARAYSTNDRFELRPTAALFNEKANADDVTASLATKQDASPVLTSYVDGGTQFRNRIINGDMRIDQRNAGASVTPTNSQYLVDRWQASLTQASKYTAQQNAGSVTPPVGFKNYLGFTSSSAYSVLAGDIFGFGQIIEGFNAADFGWGTANAQSVTLSFWVRSSLTGSFGGAVKNDGDTRNYPFTFTIIAANTWEQKTVTIAGDTSGTWGATNGAGINIRFSLGCGSTYSGTAGAWTGTNVWQPTGSTSVVATNGATFYITGVQLEKGSTATSFDYRPYGTELALCQRYYEIINFPDLRNQLVTFPTLAQQHLSCIINYAVTKRVVPTITQNVQWDGGSGGVFRFSKSSVWIYFNDGYGGSDQSGPGSWEGFNTIKISAEL